MAAANDRLRILDREGREVFGRQGRPIADRGEPQRRRTLFEPAIDDNRPRASMRKVDCGRIGHGDINPVELVVKSWPFVSYNLFEERVAQLN
jgi:hypothetical protein